MLPGKKLRNSYPIQQVNSKGKKVKILIEGRVFIVGNKITSNRKKKAPNQQLVPREIECKWGVRKSEHGMTLRNKALILKKLKIQGLANKILRNSKGSLVVQFSRNLLMRRKDKAQNNLVACPIIFRITVMIESLMIAILVIAQLKSPKNSLGQKAK